VALDAFTRLVMMMDSESPSRPKLGTFSSSVSIRVLKLLSCDRLACPWIGYDSEVHILLTVLHDI
jgi:hypothetical protein